jgi:hypothetical protein
LTDGSTLENLSVPGGAPLTPTFFGRLSCT